MTLQQSLPLAALVELAKSIPVHFLILSSHFFFCLPFFFFLSLCRVKSSLLSLNWDLTEPPSFQGQEFVIFPIRCLNLSANMLIGDMPLILSQLIISKEHDIILRS